MSHGSRTLQGPTKIKGYVQVAACEWCGEAVEDGEHGPCVGALELQRRRGAGSPLVPTKWGRHRPRRAPHPERV